MFNKKVKTSNMLEVSFFIPKKNKRYTLSIGHGSVYIGQTCFFSIIRETIEKNKTIYAEKLFSV